MPPRQLRRRTGWKGQQVTEFSLQPHARAVEDQRPVAARLKRFDHHAVVKEEGQTGDPRFTYGNERPQHDVAITHDFYMAATEVTFGQFSRFVKEKEYKTDKEQGIRQLKLTAEGGRFLRPFARLLLAVAALRDRRTGEAKMLLAGLSKEFPRNRLYAEELARLR